MQAVETIMQKFTESWKEKDNNGAVRNLKNLPDYLKQIRKNDRGRALEIVFDQKKGIFKCIETLLESNDGNLRKTLERCFYALQIIMKLYKEEYEVYVSQTFDATFDCIKMKCWFYARKTAAETLKTLIELYINYELQLDSIIEHYIKSYLRLYTRKDGCVFYIVLGAIARYCPKTENMIKFIQKIFLHLLNDLKYQLNNRELTEIKLYLDCYWNLFANFVPISNQPLYFGRLYQHLSKLCEISNDNVVKNKTINILSTYMKHFSPLILNEHEKWHALLNTLLNDKNYTVIDALKNLYKTIVTYLLKQYKPDMFAYFKNYLVLNLCNKDIPSNKLQLVIYGLGEFSKVYEKYSPMEIFDIFQMIAHRTSHFYTEENETFKNYEELAQNLQALSQILQHLPNISFHQLNVVLELSILFAKRFPELRATHRHYAINSIKNTFINISDLEKNFQSEYFNSFFREGIMWSCSHTLFVDVELHKKIQGSSEPEICYKNFLPLWQSLFEIDDKFSSCLIEEIFNEFVSVLISFIDKLNLNVKFQENNLLSNTYSLLKAENETDFRFFINLVDLYVDIFDTIEGMFFENWIEKLLVYFVKHSIKHPLISGFYKLIKVIFSLLNDENCLSDSTSDLLSQYVCNVLKIICGLSGELQLSCIYLIFNTPMFFINDLIDQMTPVFKVAFTIGLTDLPLAFNALMTLEKWINNYNIQCSSDFLKNIIFYIEPYLSSEESITETFKDPTKNENETEDINKLNSEETLEELQKRILLFYGSLDSKILLDFIHKKSMLTNASWGKKIFFQCKLLFPDICMQIYFDKFIPRIIEMTKSSDEKTKISACELLGTLITVILFDKSINQCFNKTLFDIILKLASDPNDTVRNLYYPFVIELIHDISHTAVIGNKYSKDFIDSLFEGLTEEFNSCVRDSCGFYLKEFMESAVKKSWDGNKNLDAIMNRMFCRISDWAHNPSNKKRLAAAIAFNHLYIFFQENKKLYWLELFHAFVKCLEDFDDVQIIAALNLIEKYVKVNPNVFNNKSPRTKAPGYPEETFSGALIWLFQYCGSLNVKCRLKCMEIFENLSPLVEDCESFKYTLKNDVFTIALNYLEEDVEYITIKNSKTLLRSLDFYTWIFKHKFLPLEFLQEFEKLFIKKNTFLKYFTKFISIIVNGKTQMLNTLMETEELLNLISQVILNIFEFISTLLREKNLDNAFWNDDLYVLITVCTFSPNEVGITAKNLEVIKKLPRQLESLLRLITNNLPKKNLLKCREHFLIEIKNNLITFTEINEIVNNKHNISTLMQFIKGLFIMKKSNFFNFKKEFNFTITYSEGIILKIFQSLRMRIMDGDTCKTLDEKVKDYFNELIKFLFEDYELEIIQNLVKLIMNDHTLTNLNGYTTSHGHYFLETFKEPIFHCMLKNPVEVMKIFDEQIIENPHKILYIIEELLIFSKHNKTTTTEILADEIIDRCNDLRSVLNDNEQRTMRFFNINKIAVSLKKRPAEAMRKNGKPSELYEWIIAELITGNVLERKSMILRNFIICLLDEDSETNHELLVAFKLLRDERICVWLKKIQSDEILKYQVTSCFRILLKMLVATKSLVLYEAIIKFVAGTYKYLMKDNIKEFLSPYINNISDANALKSLELAYKMFMVLNSSEERFDIIKHFLLPTMELSKPHIIKKFYENKCQEMVSHIIKKFDDNMLILDKKKLIVSKIGFYNIFELIFAKFELTFINIKDPILKTEKPLNQVLVLQTLNVRYLTTACDELRELMRLLHCAAFNCCIAVVSLKYEEKFYKNVFFEDRKKNQLIWEKIVDCEKIYNFSETTAAIRKNRKLLINIRKSDSRSEDDAIKNADAYFNRCNVVSLTLLEDIHAYDLNDITLLTETEAQIQEERRLDLSFESDQLNDHECMPMISGIFVHIFNNDIARLPDDKDQLEIADLPDCLKLFRNAFCTQKNNVRLFLMKIIGNAKNAFIPCIKVFFQPLVGSIYRYLETNQLNFVIRDILVILIQSKYKPNERDETNDAQKLVEALIEAAPDRTIRIYRYNLEIIESLCSLWNNQLKWPKILERKIGSNPNLVVSASLALLRARVRNIFSSSLLCEHIIKSVQSWEDEESIVLARYEALGWILRFDHDQSYCYLYTTLSALLNRIQSKNRERWARCICSLQRGWGLEAAVGISFIEAKRLPEHLQAEAFEIFLSRIPGLDTERLLVELIFLDLPNELREMSTVSVGYILRMIPQLVARLDESDVQPLLTEIETFVDSEGVLPQQRRLGHAALEMCYKLYKGVHYLRALILGLDDPSEEVRKPLLDFWRRCVHLPEKSDERLLVLLNLYTPKLGPIFARFLCFFMMELITKSSGSDRQVQDNDEDASTWTWTSVNSCVPLFAPSLASQMRLPGNALAVGESAPKRLLLDPSQNELSWRPESRSTSRKQTINIKKNYRNFRLADRNNLDLTQQKFIESIKQFVARDWLFCKDFAVLLVCRLITHLQGTERFDTLLDGLRTSFGQILQEDPEKSNDFTAVVLEIILHSKMMSVDPTVAGKICKKLGLDSLGILLLEEEIIESEAEELEEDETDEVAAKRAKLENTEKQRWLELAKLYKLRGEVDVANSIFKRQDLFCDDMRSGVLEQAENNWFDAQNFYDMAYEVTFSSEKEYCLEGMFECLSQLASWNQINKKIEIIINDKYNSIWEMPVGKQLLPWVFRAQLQTALENFTDNKQPENLGFITNFDTWIQTRETAMNSAFGDEIAVFYLCGHRTTDMAKHALKCFFNQLREQWIHLSPLSEKIRMQILMKLRGVHSIQSYIETARLHDYKKSIRKLIRYWDSHAPSVGDDLLSWNIHTAYRLTFVHLLHAQLSEITEASDVSKELLAASVRQKLKMSDLALKYKNHAVAKKHTLRSEPIVNYLGNNYLNLKNDFLLVASKYKFFCGDCASNVKEKFKYYLSSWEIAETIINNEKTDILTKTNAQHHLFDLSLNITTTAEESREFLNYIVANKFITKNLNMDETSVIEALKKYSFNSLKTVCESPNSKELADSHTKFGKYCYSLLHGEHNSNPTIYEEFISSILTAMSLGSLEAAHYFPCLLKDEYYKNNDKAVKLFTSKSEQVPSWLFLSWQAQILSYLSKRNAEIVNPIVSRLIRDYPNGIMYNFQQTYKALPKLETKPEIRKMYESLFGNKKIKIFFKAMHRVCQPEHYLRYHLLKLVNSSENLADFINALIDKVFTDKSKSSSLQGPIYKVLEKYRSQLIELKTMDDEDVKKGLSSIAMNLYVTMKKRLKETRTESISLFDYSPYLKDFRGEEVELEVPGQYRENRKPMPQYHTKILKFDQFVRVMESKCNPIMIRMIGNNAKPYDFLVKFGEDLRLDQRLQQIFNIMNKTLDADTNCKQRYLSINTYHVVPLSASLGLIEWVDETKSLADFVQFSMPDKSLIEEVSVKYQRWIEKAGASDKKSNSYKKALLKYTAKKVTMKMNKFISYFDWDCLRKTFVTLSPSCECFVSLRLNFIRSYATMCLIHWVTGVGDRHLGNTLIQVKTGKCFGIDFESAFGTGIDQSIPELVPFRLTTQILGLLKPFNEYELFGVTMTHVLRAIRNDIGPMLACLDIFINEPLDWSKYVNKQINDEQQRDIKWLPKKKIAIVEQKLNGDKPSTIMLEELADMHLNDDNDENCFLKYERILNGLDRNHANIRSKLLNKSLTPEEQVQCLLEQATDLNILGRMWVGWCPFV